jgi:hypothetical protein
MSAETCPSALSSIHDAYSAPQRRDSLVLQAQWLIPLAARNLHTAGTSQAGGLIFAYFSPPLRQIDTMPNIGDPPCLTTAVVPVRP